MACNGPGKGIRKWHPRTFSGCPQCRQRHVKCDETPDHCSNCTRLNLVCEGYKQKIKFKIVGKAPQSTRGSPPSKRRRTAPPIVCPSPAADSQHHEPEYNFSADDSSVPASTDVANYILSRVIEQPACSLSPAISCPETRYYAHFLSTVSSLLIIYDSPHNSNPFRLSFPVLAHDFLPLLEAMKALGALHLANISSGQDKLQHNRTAMEKYGAVVADLQQTLDRNFSQSRLAVLATSLLLCMFEVDMVQNSGRTDADKDYR